MRRLYIDVGSTNVKWLYDGKEHRAPFPAPVVFKDNLFEVDGHEILSDVKSIIQAFSADEVYFSVQMHGYVLLKGGECATNYISWRDERGRDSLPAFTLTPEYGVAVKPNLPRLSLQAQKAEADEFCTLGSFLVRMLTGNNATHITDAAASGFYNVKRKTVDQSGYRLPQARYRVEEVGRYGECAVFTPVGDMQCAVLGGLAGRSAARAYLLNLGTAGQLCALSDEFIEGEFESRPFFYGKTLCTVTRLPAGDYLSREGDEDTLYSEYRNAIKKLPLRKELLVMGGAALYHRAKLKRVLNRLGLPYEFCDGGEALNGLKILSEEQQ